MQYRLFMTILALLYIEGALALNLTDYYFLLPDEKLIADLSPPSFVRPSAPVDDSRIM